MSASVWNLVKGAGASVEAWLKTNQIITLLIHSTYIGTHCWQESLFSKLTLIKLNSGYHDPVVWNTSNFVILFG